MVGGVKYDIVQTYTYEPIVDMVLYRVVEVRGLSMFGRRGMEAGTTTPVLLTATPPAYTPSLWGQLTRLEGRLTMTRTVQGKWLLLLAITQTRSQD